MSEKGDTGLIRLADRKRQGKASICDDCHRASFHAKDCPTGRVMVRTAAQIREGMQA